MPQSQKQIRSQTLRGAGTSSGGFTLIELILVMAIVALTLGLVSVRLGAIDFWREQTSLRKLTETIILLNNQAVLDQQFYRLEFDLKGNSFRAGVLRPEDSGLGLAGSSERRAAINLDPLEEQLALLLSPESSSGATMIPPPSMPSLAEPTKLGGRYVLLDVVTSHGKFSRDDGDDVPKPAIRFSPRGVSDFGVIHISTGAESAITVLANPWTGLAEVYPGYREFEVNRAKLN
jgi:prepilin-type N-terminal cleavage/methylation domain-containing protein